MHFIHNMEQSMHYSYISVPEAGSYWPFELVTLGPVLVDGNTEHFQASWTSYLRIESVPIYMQ